MKNAAGAIATQLFQCRGGELVYVQPTPFLQLAVCRLAAAAQADNFACTAGETIEEANGVYESCVLAKPARFGPLDPADAADGFGLRLPPGAEAALFYRAEALA